MEIKPEYYRTAAGDVIDAMRGMMSVEEVKGFCKGNVIKYVARAGKKPNTDAIEDLTKARTYIARLIEMETTTNGEV